MKLSDIFVPRDNYASLASRFADNAASKESIQEELNECEARVQKIHDKLSQECSSWFGTSKQDKSKINYEMFEYLFLPRMQFSTSDAIYCAKFMLLLDKIVPETFSILKVIT